MLMNLNLKQRVHYRRPVLHLRPATGQALRPGMEHQHPLHTWSTVDEVVYRNPLSSPFQLCGQQNPVLPKQLRNFRVHQQRPCHQQPKKKN